MRDTTRIPAVICLMASGLLATVTSLSRGAITPEQRREINSLSTEMGKVGRLFGQEKLKLSAESLAGVQERLETLADGADEDVLDALADVHRKLVRAHALLELEGVRLQPLKPLGEPPAEPQPTTPGDGVGFTKQVAPMLVAKCGNCHVTGSRGQFNMANYAALMRGSQTGAVVFAGDAQGSRLVEVIESGDMPRGNGSVSPEELTALKSWIQEGAKFDGPDPDANLASLSAAPVTPNTTPPPTRQMTNGAVSFALDIAPLLATNCNGCHVNPQQQARGG